MHVLRHLAAGAVALLALPLAHADAETRVALVIGNAAYQNVAGLRNPINDADLIAAALKRDGFAISVADDLGHAAFLKTLRAFQDQADNADWAVVYYAGHGVEMSGTNYLIPIDARLAQDRDVLDEAISLDRVMTAVEGARALRIVILDACRNNPFLTTMKRSGGAGRDVGRGLALVEPEQATLLAYSAKAGTVAADGEEANSPFAAALAQHLGEPGVEVDKLFRLVRDDVRDATGMKQEPFVYGSLGRQDFYFLPPPGQDKGAAAGNAAGAAPTPGLSVEIVFWNSIVNSTNPADFEAYLSAYPSGSFAPLASNRLAALTPADKQDARPKPAKLAPAKEVRARHIMVATEEEAREIIAELKAGADFATIAKEKSTDPGSAGNGGDLGYFTRGQMVPEFEAAAFALGPGQFTQEPVKTQFGWHVIKVEDRRG